MTTNPGKKPSSTAPIESPDLKEEIQARAFVLYEERGREQGHELEDWLRAEEQIKRESTSIAA
jgi:hypothetical protein